MMNTIKGRRNANSIDRPAHESRHLFYFTGSGGGKGSEQGGAIASTRNAGEGGGGVPARFRAVQKLLPGGYEVDEYDPRRGLHIQKCRCVRERTPLLPSGTGSTSRYPLLLLSSSSFSLIVVVAF